MNTKLEVRRIPPELNNITKLNEHFSKFGTIVNIQVDPGLIYKVFDEGQEEDVTCG